MTENTFFKPRLIIGDKECTMGMKGNINFPGNNQANSFTCTLSDPEFQNSKLFNKEIKFYLNYGGDDGIPIFRGYIKDVTPNDTQTKIKAIDGRTFINSKDSKTVEFTDKENYDGHTLSSFLYNYILEKINTNKTYIGLDMLKDTNPSITMSNIRSKTTPPYRIVTEALKKAIDDTDVEKPLAYFIDMVDDGEKSNITFVKEKVLTEIPSLILSFSDGISNYSYKRRAPANYGSAGGTSFTYGNSPLGSIGISLKGKFKDKNEARQELIKNILLQYRETDEISLECTRGHYVSLGSIVRVVLDNEDIGGNHRVTSKSISFGKGGVKLSLSLNKKPIILSEYI